MLVHVVARVTEDRGLDEVVRALEESGMHVLLVLPKTRMVIGLAAQSRVQLARAVPGVISIREHQSSEVEELAASLD
jgi:CBS-domain-containing membrane protein